MALCILETNLWNILEKLYSSFYFFILPTQDLSKSPKTMKKLLPKRKPERKPSDEEFALRKSKRLEQMSAQYKDWN